MDRNQRNRKYSPEFRQRAMALAKELGNTSEAARKLGIPKYTLSGWIWNESKSQDSPEALSTEEQLRQLQRENGELRKANFILKQAAAFFSQDHLK